MHRLFLVLLLLGTLIGCGNEENRPPPVNPPPTDKQPYAVWEPPTQYTDNTVLDPKQDLEGYLLYVTTDNVFTDDLDEVAMIAAVDNVGDLTKEFNLRNLNSYVTLDNGIHFVAIRALSSNRKLSGFTDSSLWENYQ